MADFSAQIANQAGAAVDVLQEMQDQNKSEYYGRYFPTVLVGLGGTGAKILQRVRQLTIERFGSLDRLKSVRYVSIDTDTTSVAPDATSKEELRKNPLAQDIAFAEQERINLNAPVLQYLGANLGQHPHIQSWLDPVVGNVKLNLAEGAGQIRPAARLALFHNMFGGAKVYETLEAAYNAVRTQDTGTDRVNRDRTMVFLCGSFAGGTGSGIFLDVAAALRSIGGSTTSILGFFVLPDVFHSREKAIGKARANGYACLTELNHFLENRFDVQWSDTRRGESIHPLFDHIYLFDGINEAKERIADADDAYRIVGDNLFSEFFQGDFAGVKRSVRVNRVQYLAQTYTKRHRMPPRDTQGQAIIVDAERFRCQFQSFGMSRIVFPAWRLLNAGSYLLARELVRRLDDPSPILKDIVQLRAEFARSAGFFQGDLVEPDGTRTRNWMVCQALAQLGTDTQGVTSLRDEIANFAGKLRDPQWCETAYLERATGPRIREADGELANLWINPFSEGRRGPRPEQVEKNRQVLVRTVATELTKVIEAFCNRGDVGPTRIAELLQSLVDEIRQAQQHYIVQLQDEANAAKAREEQHRQEFEKAWVKAVEAERGFLVGKTGRIASVEKVADAMQARWQAACDRKVFLESITALEQVVELLVRAKEAQENLGRDLQKLADEYDAFAAWYSRKDSSVAVEEVDPGRPAASYLDYYLGNNPDARRQALDRLFARARARLGIPTNAALLQAVQEDRVRFARSLREQCWLALRGENGRTVDFAQEGGAPLDGFIEHHSVLRILADHHGSPDAVGIRTAMTNAFRKARPWIYPTENVAAVQGLPQGVKRDCFVALAQGSHAQEGRVKQTLEEALKNQADQSFKPQLVKGADPSEIVIYMEATGFIPAYLSTLYGPNGMQKAYEDCLNRNNIESALHIDKNVARFQRLVPLEPGDLPHLFRVWSLFLKGVLVGEVRSQPGPAGDDFLAPRFLFQERRTGARVDQALGTQEQAIDLLLRNRHVFEKFDREVGRAWGQVAPHAARVLALCRYYRLCVFPALKQEGGSGAGQAHEAVASLAYLVLEQLEDDLIALGRLVRGAELEERVGRHLRDLPGFTRLIGHTNRDVTALTAGQRDRYTEHSAFVDRDDLRNLLLAMLPEAVAGRTWERAEVFPWLALDLAKLDQIVAAERAEPRRPDGAVAPPPPSVAPPPPVVAPPPPAARWHYNDGANTVELGVDDVVLRICAAPGGAHHLWRPGQPGWLPWTEVPEVATRYHLAQASALNVTADPGPSWHWSPDRARQEVIPEAELVRRIVERPEDAHVVWKAGLGDWTDWSAVPELKARVDAARRPAGPPPLLGGPPPLRAAGPPPMRPVAPPAAPVAVPEQAGAAPRPAAPATPIAPAAVVAPPPPAPAAPPRPDPVTEETWFLVGDDGQNLQLATSAVAARIAAAPHQAWRVWKVGLAEWTDWRNVPELQSAVSRGGQA